LDSAGSRPGSAGCCSGPDPPGRLERCNRQDGERNRSARTWSGNTQSGTQATAPTRQTRQLGDDRGERSRTGERRGREDRTERSDRDRSGSDWQSRTSRSGTAVQSGSTRTRSWNDDSRQRDGSRSWNDDDRRRSNDGDWRSRVQKNDRHYGGNRDYWSKRTWSNHWDRSRHRNWSGWNTNWNWTYGHDYRRWDRKWRSHSHYDWYGWRNRYPSYFQVGYYYAPYRGYSYSRLSIGFFLDALFFARTTGSPIRPTTACPMLTAPIAGCGTTTMRCW
jgi:hypothetical protein